ncbi:MAG: sigma-70 family RNA polymerase sigma factor [Vicinamibacterales bacterium]
MVRGELEQRFDALLKTHGPSLARLAASYARRASEHDDLFQEIALAIWRALPGFRGECSERTFVFRIAHNRGISYLARRRTPVAEDDEREMPDRRPNPEQALSANEESERLAHAVQHLPVAHRQVVTLALEGFAYGEIADVLGLSETNVGVRLTRARQMLREMLKRHDTRS